jgi:ATP-dependent helicase/nuclease subunit A
VEVFSESTGDRRLKELVINVYSFLRSMPFYKEWLDEKIADYDFAGDDIEHSVWGGYIKTICRTYLDAAYDYAKKAISKNITSGYAKALQCDIGDIDYMKSLLEKDLVKFGEFISGYKFCNLGRTSKNDDKDAAVIIKNLRDSLKKSIDYIRDNFFYAENSKMSQDMKCSAVYLKNLTELIKKFDDLYSIAKKEKNIVDFSDLEHFAIQILVDENGNPSSEALELQQRFYEVMTDEYQDSNPVQEMILQSVSGRGKGENNRFMVGDVKQSIYRFRQAAPELFTEKYEVYKREGKQVKIDLIKNFRSRKEILDCTNFIFEQLFSYDLGEMEYTDGASLKAGAIFDKSQNNKTELDIIELENKEETDEDSDITNIQMEFMFAAKRINELVSSGFTVRDKESGKERKIKYSDIVVLLRTTKNWADTAQNVFSAFSIPAFSDINSGYLSRKEIKDIMSLIRVIDNFRQDIPLMASLKIPYYGCDDDDLLKIRMFCDGDFCDCLRSYAENGEDEILRKKINMFINDITDWKNKSAFISVRELLWDIYTKTGYYDYCLVLPSGKTRQANLRMLLERAQNLEDGNMRGLFNFVRYIEKVEKSGADIGEAKIADENENLVRIMSIHKSKGLEFPVVFICGLGKKFNVRDSSEAVLLHRKMGLACDFTDIKKRVKRTTLSKNIISDRLKNESLSEEMRILYVAMTRAKEKLIFTGTVKNVEKSCQKWALFADSNEKLLPYIARKNAYCYLDWICSAVSRHKDGEAIRDLGGISIMEGTFFNHPSKWNVNTIRKKESLFIKECTLNEKSIENKVPVIDMNWKYKHEDLSQVPSNISISDLKRMLKNEEQKFPALKEPEFISNKFKKISPAQKGTAMHSVLEYIDFRKNYTISDLNDCIGEMTERKLLLPDEAQSVDRLKIIDFLNSDLGERIRNADEVKKEAPFALSLAPYEIYKDENFRDSKEIILIHGIIDCFFKVKGKTVLLDYKTDMNRDENEEIFIKKYLTQLKVYAMAIERDIGRKPDEVYIYSFALGRKIAVCF